MSNTEKLKDYLLGKEEKLGYLLDDKHSNGKVIMLSGVWGSGKTHFWQKVIIEHLNSKKVKKPNIYISLYGLENINDIKHEILTKSILDKFPDTENHQNIVDGLSLFGNITKNIANIIFPNSGEKLDSIKDNFISTFGNTSLSEGSIICFDDFERKSKNIDLNDLFGFITQLAMNFNCKVIVILNSDVFEGKDKEIFTYVKEKSVNKFFKFKPSSENLLDLIYPKFKIDDKYKTVILDAINDMNSINARIYENILENLEEYMTEQKEITDEEIRYFVLAIITFNLNHIVFKFYDYPKGLKEKVLAANFYDLNISIKILHELVQHVEQLSQHGNSKLELIDFLNQGLEQKYKNTEEEGKKKEVMPTERLAEQLEMIDTNSAIIWSFWKLEVKLKYRENVTEDSIKNINDFIETGIL